jgi:hypothetical protein
MRIGLIRIDTLVKIRQSFGIIWRLGVSIATILVVTVWKTLFNKDSADFLLLRDNFLHVMFVCFLLLLVAAVFKKNGFARAFFATVSGFAGIGTLITIPIIILQLQADILFTAAIILLLPFFVWHWFLHYSYALWRSLVSTGSYSAYYHQLVFTSQLARKKNRPGNRIIKKAIPLAKKWFHLFIPGILAFAAGTVGWLLVVLGIFQQDILHAVHRLDVSAVAHLVKDYHINPVLFNNLWEEFYLLMIPVLFGWFGFMIFSYIWHRWQRSQIPKYAGPIAEQHHSPFVLLLRSFEDDVMRVPNRRLSLRRVFLMPYEWNFTFEELIKKRLSWIGPLVAFGDQRKKLPPLGAPREYWDIDDWVKNIIPRMQKALIITVIVGPVKDKNGMSTGLDLEMKEIEDRDYQYKTIFLMPPLLLKKNINARWEKLVGFIAREPHIAGRLRKIKPSKVLAVCYSQKDVILLTGSWNHELFYESALDIAGVLANAGIDSSKGKMIGTYLHV